MEKKKFSIHPVLFLVLLPIIIALVFMLVYYTSEIVVVNKFSASTYNVEIVDNKANDWGVREVTIFNKEETNTPVVLRVSYNESWTSKDGDFLLTLSNNIDGVDVADKVFSSAFANNFVKGDDGWYYYKKVLNAKDSVKLLEGVYLNEEVVKNSTDYEKYMSYTYNLAFNYEAIQATDSAVFAIWNKKVKINGNEVKWNF